MTGGFADGSVSTNFSIGTVGPPTMVASMLGASSFDFEAGSGVLTVRNTSMVPPSAAAGAIPASDASVTAAAMTAVFIIPTLIGS